MQETIELCELQATEEQAKVTYVLDLFDTSGVEELREKANQGKQVYGFSRECMNDYLAVQTHAHPAASNDSNLITQKPSGSAAASNY